MPSSLCTEESPIDCSSFCEAESFNETNCQSYVNSACEFSCVIKSTNGTPVVALVADLGCDVLRRYTRDICPNLFRTYDIWYICFSLLTFLVLESSNTTTTPMPTSPDPSDDNEEIAQPLSGVTVGVIGTTVVAVTVCCIWCACYRKRYATQVTYGYTSCTQLEQKLWQLFCLILFGVQLKLYNNVWFRN